MRIDKNLLKAKNTIDKLKLKICLSINRLDDGITVDYDIMRGDSLFKHVCSFYITEEEFMSFVKKEKRRIERVEG